MDQATEELSAREIEILQRVSTGATNQQVALELGISVNTVKAHLRRIFGKLGVESRTEATTLAIQRGLVQVGGLAPDLAAIARADEANGAAEAGGVADEPARAPVRPAWRLLPAQWAVLAAGLLGVLALTFWPAPLAARPGASNPFVDLPAASRSAALGAETEAQRWTERAAMPAGLTRFAQAHLDGAIYTIGGLGEDGWSTAVTAYDPATDAWTPRASKPTPAANIGAAMVEGRLYVPGGYDVDGHALRVLEIYDPATDAWTRGADLPVGLYAYAIAEDGDGFYLLGGHDGSAYVDAVYRYSASDDAWRLAGRLPTPRAFAAAAVAGGRVYLLGGYDGERELADCASFEAGAAAAGQEIAWTEHAPLAAGRAGHAAAAADGKIYVVGGGWEGALAFNEVYDAAHDVWSTFASPVIGQWRTLGLSALTALDGTRLYAMGGWNGRALSGVRVYQATFRVYAPLQ